MEEIEYKPDGKLWFLVILVSIIFAGSLYYFGLNQKVNEYSKAIISSSPDNNRQARMYTVFYNTGVFSPTNIRVHVGDSIKFQNDSSDSLYVVSDSTNNILDLIGFDSVGNIPPKSSFVFTFSKAGSFGYHNNLEKSEQGMVIVRP